MGRTTKQVLSGLVFAAILGGLSVHTAFAQARASVSDIAGRPNAVFVTVPTDPCAFLYRHMPSGLRNLELDFGPVALDQRALFTHYCEEKVSEVVTIVRAPFESAQKKVEGDFDRITGELTAGFWKFIAEALYDQLPAGERAKFRPGSPELDALAHQWLNEAPKEAGRYAAAYLTAGGQDSRIYNAWKAYVDLTNGESKTIVAEMRGLLDVAKRRLRQVVNASEELAEPDTSTVDALEGVGLSGAWLDNLKSYEGELRGLNSSYRITDVMQIVSSAMGSEQPSDKIRGFFQLIKISGAIASESRTPLFAFVGDIIQQYADAANALLDSVIALENQIAKRNGFCLGVGVPSRDTRQAYFVDQNVLACPLAYGTWPFKHIYQSQGAGPARLFFYDGDSFVESTNGSSREGVSASLALIDDAIDLGYPVTRDPDDHVSRLATVYNTSHPGGIPALMAEAQELVDDIEAAISSISKLHLAGDSCSQDDVLAHVAREAGLSVESFARDTAKAGNRLVNAIAASFVAFEGGFSPSVSRGANAYETYQQLAEQMRETSVLVLEGRVLDQRRNAVPGAYIDIRISDGDEVRGCEAWQADGSGRFFIYAVGRTGLQITARAETQSSRGDPETFDAGYFRRVGSVSSGPDRPLVARAAGDIVLEVELPEEPENDQDTGDSVTGKAEGDQDDPDDAATEDDTAAPLVPPECTVLGDLTLRSGETRDPGQFSSVDDKRSRLSSAIEAARQAGGCAPEIAEGAQDLMQRLDRAIQREADIARAVVACEPDIIAEQIAAARDDATLINPALIEYLESAHKGLGHFSTGRQAYLDNNLDGAEARLKPALEAFGTLPENACARYIERAKKGLSNIAEIRSLGSRLDSAVDTCSVSGLEDLRSAIAGQTHPAFAGFRTRIAAALSQCGDKQRRDAAEAACSRAQASLNSARDSYRGNQLDLAERQLWELLAALNEASRNVCPDMVARADRGLANIAEIRSQQASLRDAIDRCDIDGLKGLRSQFSAQNHQWFREATGRIEIGISQCEKDDERQSADVCQQIAEIEKEAGSAYQAGNFRSALDRVIEARSLAEDITQMEGCEGQRQRISGAVTYFSTLVDLLASVDAAVTSCDVESFDRLRGQLGAYDHATVTAAVSRLDAAPESCADESDDGLTADPLPPTVQTDPPASSDEDAGALAVMRAVEVKIAELLAREADADNVFTKDRPYGDRDRASIEYNLLSTSRTNDVASSRSQIVANISLEKFSSSAEAQPVLRNGEQADDSFGFPVVASGGIEKANVRFARGIFRVGVEARLVKFTPLDESGERDETWPWSILTAMILANMYHTFLDPGP